MRVLSVRCLVLMVSLPSLLFVNSTFAQDLLRLTTNNAPKHSVNISGNGDLVAWVERPATYEYVLKAAGSDLSPGFQHTVITSTATGISGLTGQCWAFGDENTPFYMDSTSIRLSHDGTKAAALLDKSVASRTRYCFALAEISEFSAGYRVVPLYVPADMGTGEGLDIYYYDAFDISSDGKYIVYSLVAKSDLSGTQEDASALIAIDVEQGHADCLAGCYKRAAGDYAPISSYPAEACHIGKPKIAGDWVVFSANNTCSKVNTPPEMTDLYKVRLSGGAIERIDGYYLSEPWGVGNYAFYFRSAYLGRFISLIDGVISDLALDPYRQDSPFHDSWPGLVEVGGPGQAATESLGIRRSWGVDQQFVKDQGGDIPSGWSFGYINGDSGYPGETTSLAAKDGSVIVFPMVNPTPTGTPAASDKQDLFVLRHIVSHEPTATPTNTPTATFTATSSPTPKPGTAPSVRVYGARGKAGSKIPLRYYVRDKSGRSKEEIEVLRSRTVLKLIKTAMSRIPKDGNKRVLWNSRGRKAGAYRYCVTAINKAGRQSRKVCGSLVLTR